MLSHLTGSDTSRRCVNQYRWINFWMAILGQILTLVLLFFVICYPGSLSGGGIFSVFRRGMRYKISDIPPYIGRYYAMTVVY